MTTEEILSKMKEKSITEISQMNYIKNGEKFSNDKEIYSLFVNALDNIRKREIFFTMFTESKWLDSIRANDELEYIFKDKNGEYITIDK